MVEGGRKAYVHHRHSAVVAWRADITAQQKRDTGPVLSQQVKGMVSEGNQAYVDGRVQDAVCIMQEVIRIELFSPPFPAMFGTPSQTLKICCA